MQPSPNPHPRPMRASFLRARLIVPLVLAALVGTFALVAFPLLHGQGSVSAKSITIAAPSLPEGAIQSLVVPGSTTYLGAIPGTQAFVGLVRNGSQARAYVCDGKPGQHLSLSDWFSGQVSNGALGAKSLSGDQLNAQFGTQNATGTLTLANGKVLKFTLPVVTDTAQAGIFEGTESVQGQLKHVGWLLLPNGDQRGFASGVLLPVTSKADGSGVCPSPANCTLRQAITLSCSKQSLSR